MVHISPASDRTHERISFLTSPEVPSRTHMHVRYVWQIGDLVVGSVSPFSVDKLHYKDTVSVGVCQGATSSATPDRPCKSLACVGPLVALSPLSFVCPTAPLVPCLSALVVGLCLLWPGRICLCRVAAVFLFGAVLPCPVLLVAVQKVLAALQ